MARETIYLAGPDVFLPDAKQVGERKRALCEQYGFSGLYPGDGGSSDPREIFDANCALMERADIGLFNLTPFRGPSADAGTVVELGFMFSKRKAVFGYSGVGALYADRVAYSHGPVRDDRDRNGLLVEDFGEYDNLMIAIAIERAGGSLTIIEEDSLAALRAFEKCLSNLRV